VVRRLRDVASAFKSGLVALAASVLATDAAPPTPAVRPVPVDPDDDPPPF
jgi:hypothetical protein